MSDAGGARIPDSRRRGVFGLILALLLAAGPARATDAKPAADDPQTRLRSVQESIDASVGRRRAMQTEIDAIKDDRAKLKAALIEATRHVGEDEQKIADTQARLDALATSEAATKRSLEGRRAIIAEVLAALQRMGRKPPPALLVDPADVLKAIRTSMLLGSVLPSMKAETDALVADLTELGRVHASIETEHRTMADDLAGLRTERERLAGLIDARQSAIGKAETALGAERDHAQTLAGQVSSLKELIGRLETESKPAADAAAAARKADEQHQSVAALTPDALQKLGAEPFKDPARLAPALAFGTLKGLLSRPVTGSVLRGYGTPDSFGGTEKGLSLQTRVGAVVAAPSDGWIAYAGPYRSFGQLLIVNAGNGYYIVLAGMDRINVDLGQFVLAGEPIAVMGDGSTKTAAAIALGAAQPILYVEFRKDGATIDPGPWWAKPEIQKVRE